MAFFFFVKIENKWNYNSILICRFNWCFCPTSTDFSHMISILFALPWRQKCFIRHYKRQISCFQKLKSCRIFALCLVWWASKPRMSTCCLIGLCPSWWQRRLLSPESQPRGVGQGVRRTGCFHPDAPVGMDTFHLCKAKRCTGDKFSLNCAASQVFPLQSYRED